MRTLLLCGAMALVLSACSRKPEGGPRRPPTPVLTAAAWTRDVPVEIDTIGTVRAWSVVTVRPQITGPILDVHFEEGAEVREGDLLFSLDARPWEALLNQARANLRRDEAQLRNALLQFQRTSNLFESRIASQQDLDTALAAYLTAQGTVAADQAAITNAQVSLGYTSIRAPIDGRTGNVMVRRGNVVKAPDDALVTLAQIRPVFVTFSVPEQHLNAVRRGFNEAGLPVRAFAPGETNLVAHGELTFIDNTVDTNTGTLFLKGTFANADQRLWPGQFVQVSLTLSNLAGATVVPAQAVQTGQNGEHVFVVKGGDTAELRPVRAGITREGLRVIHDGLAPGEIVVIDGQSRLAPGAKVNVPKSPGRTNEVRNPA